MQNPNPTKILFLEDWLRSATATTTTTAAASSSSPPPPSARAILQAWAELRDPSLPATQPHRLLAALLTLSTARSSIHVADPQAKLLLSLLSSSPPPESQPLLLRLLYVWLRKSPRPAPHLLLSAARLLSRLLSPPSPFPPDAVLILGALSAVPDLAEPSRSACLDLLFRLLDEERPGIASHEELVPEVLSGIGYALSRSDGAYFTRISASLLGIWDAGHGPPGFRPTLSHGLMLLRLVEWCTLGFIDRRALDRIESLCGEISTEKYEVRGYARFAIVMASAGVLRAFRIASSSNKVELYPRMRNSVEGSIGSVAKYTISSMRGDCNFKGNSEHHLLLQCISLGLARCGSISFCAPVLLCLCFTLLNMIFPLPSLFRMLLGDPSVNSAFLGLNEVKEHLASVMFKEAGAVTGLLCNQYALADEDNRVVVESHIWQYSHELYRELRVAALVNREKCDELLGDLEKIAEAAFLMIVVFAAEVSKHKLNPKSYRKVRPDVAIKILSTFSCIEFLRRVRLPEYTDAVRRAVLTIQENAALCALFVESMPPYVELTNQQGSFTLEGRRYLWSKDEVQTARMLFYLRVIPTCISLISASLFGKLIAPTMFLYMQHPNEKVARASHSVFVAFISSVKDSEQDDRSALKEQLVFYYIQRALEAYPGVTPFEGLASGVAAVVRHLPAGSPAIFYCVHSLVGKATDLCRRALTRDGNLWKNWEGTSEPCKKDLDLLLRLISLVDIQVLPFLLKQLAEFVVQLPKDGQNAVLDEMYTQVAESDDVTRKPVLVSWLQSLSYLCSQAIPVTTSSVKGGGDAETSIIASGSSMDGLSLNSTSSRL